MRWQLIVCYECDVLGDTVLMPWIVEEVAGAACGVDCSCKYMVAKLISIHFTVFPFLEPTVGTCFLRSFLTVQMSVV